MNGADIICIGLLGLLLVWVTVIDLREQRIPNELNLAIGALGLAHVVIRSPGWYALASALGAMLVAGLLFGGTAWILRRVSSRASIGMGDLKFLTAASLWVGWDGSVVILMIACLCAVLVSLAVAPWQGLDLRKMRPFGPMLAVGMIIVVTLSFHTQSMIR
jgi:leader peptidase (prepilin peptidase) / N-methyltransferase